MLFNWQGYRLLISFLEETADQKMETQFDFDHYDATGQLSIKIPIKYLPYYVNSSQYERVNGEIDINGIPYKFVKQRFLNDSLELICIPNHAALTLRSAKENIFGLVNDLQHSSAGKKSDTHPGNSKSFSSEHYTVVEPLTLSQYYLLLDERSFHFSISIQSFLPPAIEYPPEWMA